jgi:hypothetical protein
MLGFYFLLFWQCWGLNSRLMLARKALYNMSHSTAHKIKQNNLKKAYTINHGHTGCLVASAFPSGDQYDVIKIFFFRPGLVAEVSDPIYSVGRDQEDQKQRSIWAVSSRDCISTNKRGWVRKQKTVIPGTQHV